jgi:hemerythrin
VSQWSDDLAIGVEAVDAQHRLLYEKVAELREAMRAHALDRVPAILGFLEAYALRHFAAEERLMEDRGYPGLAEHRALHDEFTREYLRLKPGLVPSPRASAVVELSEWLGAWLRDHVRRADGDLGRFLRARGAAPAEGGTVAAAGARPPPPKGAGGRDSPVPADPGRG